jgi:hypothetical protein
MPKTLTEIRSIARGHTRTAINTLVGVMRSKDATHAARVSAANAILDRGWGKPAQFLENGEDGAHEFIHVPSANNFIRAGYHLHQPENPWGWPHTLYWRKRLLQKG